MRVRVRSAQPFPQPHVDGEAESPPIVGCKFVMEVRQAARRKVTITIGPVAELGDGTFTTEAGVKYQIELLDRAEVADLRRRARRLARA